MKKSALILLLILGVEPLLAQAPSRQTIGVQALSHQPKQADYAGALFTKDGGTLLEVDFSAENEGYSTGIVTAGSEAHGELNDFATWHRWADVSDATLTSASGVYSSLALTYFGGTQNFINYMRSYLDTASSSGENGWMMMSLYDQRTPHSGNFNAYIRFDSIDASEAELLEVRLYQYYRKYYDHCYIDYSTDGVTWHETEVNVTGVDGNTHPTLWGYSTYTLPAAAAGVSNLSIRIRYKSLDSDRSAYGYWWLIDDVSIVAAPPDRLSAQGSMYVEGNYAQVPQGMAIDPAWYSMVRNTGSHSQPGLRATLYHLNANQETATPLVSNLIGDVAVGESAAMICDRDGWLTADSLEYSGWYAYITHTPHGTGTPLPTATAGDNYLYTSVANDRLTLNYDTMYYQVNTADANGNYTWAHDNGVLAYFPSNHWVVGYIYSGGSWYVSDDPDDVHYYSTGYAVTSRYTTGSEVPEDWVIKGVEMVASPVDDYHSTGAKISAVLAADQYDGASVSFVPLNTGANVKTISANDVNNSDIIGRNSNGYLTEGYNTVYIPFPEQPSLEPHTSYRIGYMMEEDGYFALAQECQGRYRIASPSRPDTHDTMIYFADNEATAKYAHHFVPNKYQNYFQDLTPGDDYSGSFAYWAESNPMIRIVVGPRVEMNRKNISVECEHGELGEVFYLNESACGEVLTPAEGSTCSVVAKAAAGCKATVVVDGTVRQPWDGDNEAGDPHLIVRYDEANSQYIYTYSFANISDDHTVKFAFAPAEGESVSLVQDYVKMMLSPNPASSQVTLTFEGFNGTAECSIIDMSGRLIMSKTVSTSEPSTFDISHLAKGTYFARATNGQYCKITKLVVR